MEEGKEFSIGDRVQITVEGANAHRQHHDDQVDGLAKVSPPVVRIVADAAKQIIFTFPEAGYKGEIVEIRERWWWQSSYDYLVKWDHSSGQSWHLSKHLLMTQ
jgi:hypothetical protein